MPLEDALPRRLGLWSAVAVLVGSTIGSGIFRSPAGIATRIPDQSLFLTAWILGGVFVLAGALTYAELAAMYPQAGGVYVYLREGFGRLPAFLFGWTELTIVRASALGAIAMVFAEYFLRLIGIPVTVEIQTAAGSVSQSAPAVHYMAVVAIVMVTGFNVVGINVSSIVQNLTTATKYGALVLMVLCAFVLGGSSTGSSNVAASPASTSVSLFGLALISILWVYDGWADVTFVSGEVRQPEKYLPLALILGTLSIIVIYLLSNLAYLRVLGLQTVAGSRLVAADTLMRMVGSRGAQLISLAVMISAFGTLNGSMMTGPRIFFAMAADGLFFRNIAVIHGRYKTPYFAILLAATLASVFVMIRSFEQLADTFVLGIWPFYAGGVAAVYTLRRKRPDLPRPYRVWGYPLTPALFIAAAVFLLGNALITGEALIVFAIILAGVPVYFLSGVRGSR